MTHDELMKINDQIDDLENIADMLAIRKGATNGDVIKAMFNVKRAGIHQEYNGEIIAVTMKENPMFCIDFDAEWWNSPYKADKDGD